MAFFPCGDSPERTNKYALRVGGEGKGFAADFRLLICCLFCSFVCNHSFFFCYQEGHVTSDVVERKWGRES